MMGPQPPQDSDDDQPQDIFLPIDDDENMGDENDVEVMTLNENDDQPAIEDVVDDLDLDDGDEENGYFADDSKMVFTQHDGSVFSVNLSPKDKTLAVSGGEDDKGCVWNITNGDIILECSDHKDSVISCGFSNDGKYVMTADMAGNIFVKDMVSKEKIWEFDCSDIEWCFWHPQINVLFAGVSDGEIYMWKIPSSDCKIYQGGGSKPLCGKLLQNGKELLAGYEDGSLKLWDLKNATTVFIYQEQDDSVLCIAAQSNGNLVACGTISGRVKVFNMTGKLVATLHVPAPPRQDSSESNDGWADVNIEGMAFSPSEQYIAAGSLDGTLYIWDLTTQRIRHHCKHAAGVNHVLWHENDTHTVITACLDGVLRKWDSRNGELIKELHGNRGNILDVCISTDGATILTGGDDQSARVFEK